MVAAGAGAGTVVFKGEAEPVFVPEVLEHVEFTDESGEDFELLALRAAHGLGHFRRGGKTELLPVEAADLEHTPESAFDGGDAVDSQGGVESCLLSALLRPYSNVGAENTVG